MLFLLQRWKLLAIGAIALAAVAYHFSATRSAYHRGHVAAQAQCDAANLKAQLAETQRQLAARDRVIAADKALVAQHEQSLKERQERIQDYVADIERLDAQNSACRASDDDARRLPELWRRTERPSFGSEGPRR